MLDSLFDTLPTRVALAAFVIASLGAGGVAVAQRDDSSDYRALIKHGIDEYSLGNFGEAYAMFDRAHKVKPGPQPLRGMAISLFELKRYVEATRAADAALAFKGAERPLDDKLRRELQVMLDRARGNIVTVRVNLQPADAELRLDGELVPGAQLSVDPGAHTLSATRDGYQSHEERFEAKIGQEPTFELSLLPSSEPVAGVTPPAQVEHGNAAPSGGPRAAQTSSHKLAWLPWTLAGVGVAALATALVTGLMTNSAYSEIDGKCPGTSCAATLAKNEDRGKTLQTMTNVLLISGGLLTAGGVTWLLLDARKPSSEVAGLRRVEIAPSVSALSCGVAMQGNF